jgi:hypothetical protein
MAFAHPVDDPAADLVICRLLTAEENRALAFAKQSPPRYNKDLMHPCAVLPLLRGLTGVHRVTIWGTTTMTGLWAEFQQWQTLIAGFLIVVAVAIAYVGALVSASRQAHAVRLVTDQQVATTRRATDQLVMAIRRATDQQVAAVRRATSEQVASLQVEREQIEERQPVEWKVQIREGRIEIAAVTRDSASPAGQREAASPIARLVVESEPFPHKAPVEAALPDDRMRIVFEELASLIDEYNSRTKTINGLAALARVVEPIDP